MQLIAVGISHKTSSIEMREKVFLRIPEREAILADLKSDPAVAEAVVLSTCNRTEIYASVADGIAAAEKLIGVLFKVKKLSAAHPLKACFYVHRDEECVRHLLRVAIGLESIVLGERQILGQVKEAVDLSRAKGMLARQFNLLTGVAIRSGKKAQTETNISCGGGSVSWAAVKIAEDLLTTLADSSALIIGAGKMSTLTAQQLGNRKIDRLYVMNRTAEKAAALAAEIGGTAVPFCDMAEVLSRVDLCICSASSPHYLISRDLMERVMTARNDKPLICIDISTPRNIDPRIGSIPNIVLLTVDDLDRVVRDNMDMRRAAIDHAERIVGDKTQEFYRELSFSQAA
jgi:glutamyl-tRNA reductase